MGCSFPTVIAAIISIAILAGVAFSSVFTQTEKPYYFAIALLGLTIWFMVIYWFCATGNVNLGWFFLILPIGIALMWYLAQWLDGACYK